MTENKIYIYALKDPNTNMVRYIGQANNLSTRFRGHLSEKGNVGKAEWISALKKIGFLPVMEEIEYCDASIAKEREQFYIDRAISFGDNLFNISSAAKIKISITCEELVAIRITKEAHQHIRIAAALSGRTIPEVSEAAFKRERERLEKEKRDGK